MKKTLLIILFLAATQFSRAQSQYIKFDHFSIEDGLPERVIQFVKQDSQGYIWIGTQNGLVRYDGYKPKVYRFGNDKDALYLSCTVRSFIEDGNKDIWVSTIGNGLFKYDRQADRFMQYKYRPMTEKKAYYTQYLSFADLENNLWAYTDDLSQHGYVEKFNQKDKSFQPFNSDQKGPGHLDVKDCYSMYKTVNGEVWLGTNNGLYKYNYKKGNFDAWLATKDTTRRNAVSQLYEAPSERGILWMNILGPYSKKGFIARFDTNTKTIRYYIPDADTKLNAANDSINAIYEDKQKRLWLGSNNGLLLLNRQSGTFTKYLPADTNKETNKNLIAGITEAKNGTLWLISGKGILNFNPVTHLFQRYISNPENPDALNGNVIWGGNLLVDKVGILWVGIDDHGVDKINTLTSAFLTCTLNAGDPHSYPGGMTGQIIGAPDGYALFTNYTGIYKWLPGTRTFNLIYKAAADGPARVLVLGKDGNIYFSNRNGLRVYNAKVNKLQSYFYRAGDTTSLCSNVITRILQDHTGIIWLGTNHKGICSFDPVSHKFKRYAYISNNGITYNTGGKLDDEAILSIFEDKQGTVWVGTNLGGLNRFDRNTGRFKSYLFDGRTRVFSIPNIFEDSKGHLWVGSYLQGLFEFDRKLGRYTRTLNEDNGLMLNAVSGIAEDDKGYLWINSDRGLTRLNPVDMSVKKFPITTILPGSKPSSTDLSFVAINKKMVLGLSNGITTFDPDDLTGNPFPPDVHIEKVGYSNPGSVKGDASALVPYGLNEIALPWNQNRLTFNYIALHYINPSQNKYKYTLIGYDKHWINAGTQREATYTNLTPGTYIFKVKASNSDGVWNNKGDSFTIIINPPWWLRWWAWLFYIIFFITALYAFVAYRSRKLMQDKRMLEQKVHARTEEVMQQKEEIEAQRDNLEKAFGDLKTTQSQLIQSEKMASLGELTAGIAHEIQNPLNFVNNFSEVNKEMLEELETEIKNGNTTDALLLTADIIQNEEKINHHGKRADGIVKGMLEHSRSHSGQKELTDLNAMADEYMRLSYHGLRAKNKSFNSELITRFDPGLPKIAVVQQDIGRILLNLFNNAFYAVDHKRKFAGAEYRPEVTVSTLYDSEHVVIKVKDNGIGIPDAIKEKIMQPFFTTKPTGEGTGLGLSLTYDMVVKGHGGSIAVNSIEGEGSEFVITLPS